MSGSYEEIITLKLVPYQCHFIRISVPYEWNVIIIRMSVPYECLITCNDFLNVYSTYQTSEHFAF